MKNTSKNNITYNERCYFDLFSLQWIEDPKKGTKTDIEYELEAKNKDKKGKTKGGKIRDSLFARDGNLCFYSNRPMSKETATIEHLIPLSKGGRNCKENLVLCLAEHNIKVGNSSLREKLEYRDILIKKKTKEFQEISSLKIQITNAYRKMEQLQKEIKLRNEQITSLHKKLKKT